MSILTEEEKSQKTLSPFSSEIPFHQFAWDSTSITTLMTCPRKYYYVIICGYRMANISHDITFGAHFHTLLENYYRRLIEHNETPAQAKEFLVVLWAKLISGWETDHLKKNPENLLRAILWYIDEYSNDPTSTIVLSTGKAAVELSFRYELGITSNLSGEDYYFCGHFDRVADLSGTGTYIVDYKTTGSTLGPYYFAKYENDFQMLSYSAAGRIVFEKEISGVIVEGVQLAQNFVRFGRGFVQKDHQQLEEYYSTLAYYLRLAEKYASEKFWPMNHTACSNYSGCQFRSVCGRSPMIRENLLKTYFKIEHWNPLKSRGEEEN